MSQGRLLEDDLSRFCCLNAACSDYGERGHGNRAVPPRYGRRTTEHTLRVVEDFHCRTGGQLMDLLSSDENPAPEGTALKVYGADFQPQRQGARGRHPKPYKLPSKNLAYATVPKTGENNRLVDVQTRMVFGSEKSVAKILARSAVSTKGDTVFTMYN